MSEELSAADHNLSEIARLRRQLALAEAEIATLRAAHAAVLAWLDVRGSLLPLAMRQELREALKP